jgi:hypothetical protein
MNHAKENPMLSSRMVLAQVLAVLVSVTMVTSAVAQPNVYAKCRKAKILARGKWQACRSAQRAKIVVGGTADFTKCDAQLQAKLVVAEKNVPGENLWICHWVDNEDGTVSDLETGLMWEKKDSDDGVANYANPHDVDNLYGFDGSGPYDIGVSFLGVLNGRSASGIPVEPGFAGYHDWRLPYVTELRSIVDTSVLYDGGVACGSVENTPCIRQTLFGPTVTCFSSYFDDCHYQSSTVDRHPGAHVQSTGAVVFNEYGTVFVTLGYPDRVRAVRGDAE